MEHSRSFNCFYKKTMCPMQLKNKESFYEIMKMADLIIDNSVYEFEEFEPNNLIEELNKMQKKYHQDETFTELELKLWWIYVAVLIKLNYIEDDDDNGFFII